MCKVVVLLKKAIAFLLFSLLSPSLLLKPLIFEGAVEQNARLTPSRDRLRSLLGGFLS